MTPALGAALLECERACGSLDLARWRATLATCGAPGSVLNAATAELHAAEGAWTAACDNLLVALGAVRHGGCQHCKAVAGCLARFVQTRRSPIGNSVTLDDEAAALIATLREAHGGLDCPRPGLPSGPDMWPELEP